MTPELLSLGSLSGGGSDLLLLADGSAILSVGLVLLLLLAGLAAFFGMVLKVGWSVMKFVFDTLVGRPESPPAGQRPQRRCSNPLCQHENRPAAHYCTRCGAAL